MSESLVCPHCKVPVEAPSAFSVPIGEPLRQRIEMMMDAFIALKNDLEAEKRMMHRQWAKREWQLEQAVLHSVGLYEHLATMLGPGFPHVANLEAPVFDVTSDLLALEPVHAVLESSPF
ncbi:MAG TPA: DUF2130 domain-containing protein [Gemmataceae bacterium]|nr:DUF2130 domain-containing protein [Gemmataceae bacterium]